MVEEPEGVVIFSTVLRYIIISLSSVWRFCDCSGGLALWLCSVNLIIANYHTSV